MNVIATAASTINLARAATDDGLELRWRVYPKNLSGCKRKALAIFFYLKPI
jgi:hypothetical protein